MGRRVAADHRRWSAHLVEGEQLALRLLNADVAAWIAQVNERIVQAERRDRKDFLDTVEKSPLTPEQARAVVTFDNRVRVIAAAGSGKTSVMVGRAAYAVERGLVPPERILMLAFNTAAAEELSARVRARFAARGLPADGVQVRTFHSFGRAVIGRATGHKPSIARWVDQGRELEKISEIVDQLRDESPEFRYRWDVFRFLYGRVTDDDEPDSYDPRAGLTGFRTFQGETVRSAGERLIADWLYLNGVRYEYERPYSHVVSDAEHAQYRPDFFYPDVDVWHEHWAIGPDGEAPEEFEGYTESMAWRKATHERFGTRLVETTWHEIVAGDGFIKLEKELRDAGLELDWNPSRPVPGAAPIEHERLAGLVRTFMSHVKSSALSPEEVLQRAGKLTGRSRLFLDIFWPIHARWQEALAAEGAIDFDDMLLGAAHHIDADPSLAPFDLVLVD
ncbi:MAG: UvrD-helicase domain-containing protein, partial [Actinomycetales bacterium]|nr:UvrD-helicase domain-containing protein [Actinomycetales bacterium]